MPIDRTEDKTVSEILVDPRPSGTVAVYLVEAGDEESALSLRKLFDELKPHLDVARLSRGRLVCYAVQTCDSQAAILDELESALKNTYPFVIMQRTFDEVIYQIVKELCGATNSRFLSVPRCNICGKLEPFPDTVITLADENGDTVMSRSYCGTCTASRTVKTNKDFVLSLLSADRKDFGQVEQSELVRSRGRNNRLRYKLSAKAPI